MNTIAPSFDKRPKFLHYQPEILVINNIEHDHVDIYPRIEDIHKAFHHLLRQLPGNAEIIARADDADIAQVIEQGLWSQLTWFNRADSWSLEVEDGQPVVVDGGHRRGALNLQADTLYNRLNALAALLAAGKVGVGIDNGLRALAGFKGIRRRLQLLHQAGTTRLYEDFAHHPTAIACVIEEFMGRIRRAGQGRLLLFVELASYSMRTGHQLGRVLGELSKAAGAYVYCPDKTLYNSAHSELKKCSPSGCCLVDTDVGSLIDLACQSIQAGDQFVIFSNRNFGGAMPRICQRLRESIDSLSEQR